MNQTKKELAQAQDELFTAQMPVRARLQEVEKELKDEKHRARMLQVDLEEKEKKHKEEMENINAEIMARLPGESIVVVLVESLVSITTTANK